MTITSEQARRFWKYVEKTNTCWFWKGATSSNGRYGWFCNLSAHRFSWMIKTGHIIPRGMFVCHTCDVGLCVNPDHLFLGTPKDNAKDKVAKGRTAMQKKTHCIQGHEFTKENTAISNRNHRYCRTCARARGKKYYTEDSEKYREHGRKQYHRRCSENPSYNKEIYQRRKLAKKECV